MNYERIYLPEEKPKKQKITNFCFDCNFYNGSNSYQKCIALSDTDFGDKPCPFHKTRKEQKEGLQAVKERLNRLGKPQKDSFDFIV